jgi:hypothetical protein
MGKRSAIHIKKSFGVNEGRQSKTGTGNHGRINVSHSSTNPGACFVPCVSELACGVEWSVLRGVPAGGWMGWWWVAGREEEGATLS